MISVIIPTLNAAARLPDCLNALIPEAGLLIREVIVVDGGSSDETLALADAAGARVLACEKGRGRQLAFGAAAARSNWLLFLHADTVLDARWRGEVAQFIQSQGKAAVFTLRFDAKGAAPRIVEAGAMLRTRLFKTPYGDQGLLIEKAAYEEAGGYLPLPIMEDVEFVERLVAKNGRRAFTVLAARAVTSAERYERDGYARRVLKNAWCLALRRIGASPETISKAYAS